LPALPLDERADLLLGGLERQVSHVKPIAHDPLLRRSLYDRSATGCATSVRLWHLPSTRCSRTARRPCACATPPSDTATAPRSTSVAARSSACWGPTERARRRSSAWSPASPARPPARSKCSATTPCVTTGSRGAR